MSRVVHFEIQADDVERAKSFYAAVFDWSFEDYGAMAGSTYWGITTGPEDEPGINGGLLQRPAPTPIVQTNALVPWPAPGVGAGRWSSPPLMPGSSSGPVVMPQ